MTAPLYAARADLYAFGLPRGSVPNQGRLLAAVSTTANTLSLGEHGFSDDDPFSLRAEAGGSLPAPLVAGTTYYAHPTTDNAFEVRATPGGPAIDLTTAGDAERIVVIAPLAVEKWIYWASRVIDEMLPARVVPLVAPYPEIVVITCAELAAGKGLGLGGASSKSLTDMIDAAKKRLDRWAAGIPPRGAGDEAQTPANLASSASVPYRDPRGWSRFGGIS